MGAGSLEVVGFRSSEITTDIEKDDGLPQCISVAQEGQLPGRWSLGDQVDVTYEKLQVQGSLFVDPPSWLGLGSHGGAEGGE